MIAAIYARKSTEQRDVDDEQKSVTRQIEHARQYAARKGWTVDDACIFVDDGISGAEFANRPGFLRLMNALQPRPRFQVLIMSEESRLGREMIQTSTALQQITRAGVRVFLYLEDRERTLSTPTEKFMLSATAFADELEREKARQRAHDTARRKFEQRQVTGGQCFGYRNVDVTTPGPDGRPKRQYVTRAIHEDEAAIVRRIFELCAAGEGLKATTKQLNADGAPAPRSQRGRPRAWAPSSVREILYRETYRGVVVWNKTRKRNSDGEKALTDRPESDWLRRVDEGLRIVPEELWQAAHGRLTERRENYRRFTAGDARSAPVLRGSRTLAAGCYKRADGGEARTLSPYLLSGLARCGVCGGSVQGASRASTTGRLFRYVCGAYVNRGEHVCANRRMASMDVADAAIRELLANEVVRPEVLGRALDLAIDELSAERQQDRRQQRIETLEAELARVESRLANLTETAAAGGAVPAILAALQQQEVARVAIVQELAQLRVTKAESPAVLLEPRRLRRELREYLSQWQQLTAENVVETRGLLQTVLRSRIVFQPGAAESGAPTYELSVLMQFDRLLTLAVPAIGPGGPSPLGKVRTPLGTPNYFRRVERRLST